MAVTKTQEELRPASDHILYEAKMLHETARVLRMKNNIDRYTRNVLIEAFGIHFRLLWDFFKSTPEQRKRRDKGISKDDMFVQDFLNGDSPVSASTDELLEDVEDYKEQVGFRIAHLSYNRLRIEPDSENWPIDKMWDAVKRALREFRECADPDLLDSDWFPIQRHSEIIREDKSGGTLTTSDDFSVVHVGPGADWLD